MRSILLRLLAGITCFATPVFCAEPPAANAVEQWGMFELTLDGPRDGNPFTDVELSARFTQGDRAVNASGFYDGEGIYKVRFMPDAVGEWSYSTTSNRPELAEKVGMFTVTSPSEKNHGPVRVAHTYHFAYADGTPFFQIGTTCYYWTQRSDEQEEQTLKTLAASPFNKLRMCVFPPSNAKGTLRFLPFEGAVPREWDATRFNPAFFQHFEKRIAQLGDIGVEADLILFHPYARPWGLNSMDAASEDRYVRYVVARLAAFRNVWWSLANEYDFIRGKPETDWDRLFHVVETSDPYSHLRSIHNGTQFYNNTQPWVTHASIQSGAAALDPERAVLFRDVYRKPIVFDEVKYEGDSAARWGQLSAEELVLRFWNGLVAGIYVGHSEILSGGPDKWLAGGGELRGKSVPRLAFLKQIAEAGPRDGINPIDKWQERRMAGKSGEYYLVYFGETARQSWPFVLYKDGLTDGMKFTVEVIDTWDMTITPVEGVFETMKRDNYDFIDKDGRSVTLPGRPYIALRIQRVP